MRKNSEEIRDLYTGRYLYNGPWEWSVIKVFYCTIYANYFMDHCQNVLGSSWMPNTYFVKMPGSLFIIFPVILLTERQTDIQTEG